MKEPRRLSHEEPRPDDGFGPPFLKTHKEEHDGDTIASNIAAETTSDARSSSSLSSSSRHPVVAPVLHLCTGGQPARLLNDPEKPRGRDSDGDYGDGGGVVNDNDNGNDNDVGDDRDCGSLRRSVSATGFPRRAPSTRAQAMAATHSSAGSLSPGSAYSSPQLAALTDITPLPSPVQLSTPLWLSTPSSFSLSRTSSGASHHGDKNNASSRASASRSSSVRHRTGVSPHPTPSTPPKTTQDQHQQRVSPASLAAPKPTHTRNRSLSEYHPTTALAVPQPRLVAVSDGNPTRRVSQSGEKTTRCKLHREEHLSVQRGLAQPRRQPRPSAPRGSSPDKATANDGNKESPPPPPPPAPAPAPPSLQATPVTQPFQTYDVWSIRTRQPRKYRKIRQLGQGAFSQVALAVREEERDDGDGETRAYTGPPRLVAVKVVEYGPAGGANEERVEVSLNREVDILKSINHPSLVQLKAFGSDKKMALLVLDYCPGGDLFELASQRSNTLVPDLSRRIFAELVGAVRYLHQNLIVHRDIKLENVLVNMNHPDIRAKRDWQTYPRAVVTLTDLGLSRRIPDPPESPLLHTRCGSEDYAAPEILMGQPYDGRATDGWALAVLLYAILEGRLPFDPLPGARGDPAKLRARTPHRIARCEWSWFKYADADGEWEPGKGKALEGARVCVEGLLRRTSRRMTLDDVARTAWVADAIYVPEGLKRGDRETP